MPVSRTSVNGKPAFRWGTEGRPYSYTPGDKSSRDAARKKAERQGKAAQAKGKK